MALFGKQLTLNSRDVPAAPPVVQCPVAFFEADESATEIGGANGGTPAVGGGAPPTAPASRGTFDFDNILKLIPGEVIAPFITGSGLPLTDIAGFPGVWWCSAAACLPVCCFVGSQQTGWRRVGRAGRELAAGGRFSVCLLPVGACRERKWPGVPSLALWRIAANMSPTAIWGFFAVIFGLIAPILVPQAPARTDG
ncbi:MAG: hypothetical protein WDN49_03450 [Acetobacteraceae bacterium]